MTVSWRSCKCCYGSFCNSNFWKFRECWQAVTIFIRSDQEATNYICSNCNKDCHSRIGLLSHSRAHQHWCADHRLSETRMPLLLLYILSRRDVFLISLFDRSTPFVFIGTWSAHIQLKGVIHLERRTKEAKLEAPEWVWNRYSSSMDRWCEWRRKRSRIGTWKSETKQNCETKFRSQVAPWKSGVTLSSRTFSKDLVGTISTVRISVWSIFHFKPLLRDFSQDHTSSL